MQERMDKPQEIWDSFRDGLKEIFTENTMNMAASLSYTSLLALVPLATVVLSMFSLFPVFSNWSEQLQEFIYNNLVPAAGDVIKDNIDSFVGKAGRLTTFGLIFLMLTALMMLSTIENSLNKIWRVHRGRSVSQRILVYWAMISLGPLLIGSGLSITSYVAALSTFKAIDGGMSSAFGIKMLPFFFESAAFVLAYMLVPNCRVRFAHAVIGGVIASLIFQIAKKCFAFYVTKFNTYEVIYGALATLPIFLIWIFVSWCVFLLGAQIAAALGRLRGNNLQANLAE